MSNTVPISTTSRKGLKNKVIFSGLTKGPCIKIADFSKDFGISLMIKGTCTMVYTVNTAGLPDLYRTKGCIRNVPEPWICIKRSRMYFSSLLIGNYSQKGERSQHAMLHLDLRNRCAGKGCLSVIKTRSHMGPIVQYLYAFFARCFGNCSMTIPSVRENSSRGEYRHTKVSDQQVPKGKTKSFYSRSSFSRYSSSQQEEKTWSVNTSIIEIIRPFISVNLLKRLHWPPVCTFI